MAEATWAANENAHIMLLSGSRGARNGADGRRRSKPLQKSRKSANVDTKFEVYPGNPGLHQLQRMPKPLGGVA